MVNAVLMAIGTGGDLFPIVHIGRLLKKRGHAVTVVTHCTYADMMTRAGLQFVALDTPESYEKYKEDTVLLMGSHQNMVTFYRRHVLPAFPEQVEVVSKLCQSQNTILIAEHNTHLVAQTVADKLGLPHLSIFMSPGFLLNDQTVIGLHSLFSSEINAYRVQLGLAHIQNWENWFRATDKKLAFWPAWFASPDENWPSNVSTFHFPLNEMETGALPDEVLTTLGNQPAPILITHGTSGPNNKKFFACSIEACLQLGYQVILATGHEENLPQPLPPNVHWFKYLAFASIMPRISAVIHHGGIGTSARALWAGTPQVVLSFRAEQFDNANRLEGMGVATHVPATKWNTAEIVQAIRSVTQSAEVRKKCAYFKANFETRDSWEALCDEIENSLHLVKIRQEYGLNNDNETDNLRLAHENKHSTLTKNLSPRQLALLAKLAKEKKQTDAK